MARGHLTRSPSGHLTRRAGRSPDSPSGSTLTLPDGLADFLVSGRARGLSPKTLDWYRMIGERFPAYRTSRGTDPALNAVSIAEARSFVSRSRRLTPVGRTMTASSSASANPCRCTAGPLRLRCSACGPARARRGFDGYPSWSRRRVRLAVSAAFPASSMALLYAARDS
jgi:hypothetical protein